jgi:hypothetical protein
MICQGYHENQKNVFISLQECRKKAELQLKSKENCATICMIKDKEGQYAPI